MSNLRMYEPRLFEPVLSDSFENMFKRFMAPMRLDVENGSLDMRVDVSEVDGMYKVQADIPSVKKEDINVRIDGNLIQIDAEAKRQKESKDNGGRLLRSERWQGMVSRSFTLSQDVDESKVVARYADGVLSLELPKKESAASRQIEIK